MFRRHWGNKFTMRQNYFLVSPDVFMDRNEPGRKICQTIIIIMSVIGDELIENDWLSE